MPHVSGTNDEAHITEHYDVVIAGASFAGLAAAQGVSRSCSRVPREGEGRREKAQPNRWRVALVDRAPLGDGVTSACAAPVSIVQAMGAGSSIQQIHDRLVIHTPADEVVWRLPEPFCTFDYSRFCEGAFAHCDAEFIHDAVTGRLGTTVRTASRALAGTILIDATGWRAALVGGPASPYVNRRWMAFGLESEVDAEIEPGLHFYFLPELKDGYAWAFAAGGRVRFGVLSYLGRSKLKAALDAFMARFGLRSGATHGGFLASGLRAPVVEGVFVVGDASGHCLPLTGEGIRTAVLGGFRCGELMAGVLSGELTPGQAATAYRAFVEGSRRTFRRLLWSNLALLALPSRTMGKAAALVGRPRLLEWFMRHYLDVFTGPTVSSTHFVPARPGRV